MALRFLAAIFLLVAVVALVSDATRSMGRGGVFEPTTVAREWQALAPASMQSAQKAVNRGAHPLVWDLVVRPAISAPIFLIFGALGLATGYAGRRRHKVNIYTN